MAADAINASGGLLGKKINVVTADDNTSPATGASNVRQMILSDHAAAIFGPVSSAVAAAEESLCRHRRGPAKNSIDLASYARTNPPPAVAQLLPSGDLAPP